MGFDDCHKGSDGPQCLLERLGYAFLPARRLDRQGKRCGSHASKFPELDYIETIYFTSDSVQVN